jgi:hypothetical protein
VTSDSDAPDPQHSVPQVSFGSHEPQDAEDRELQEENGETSLDQPSS